MGKSSRRFSRTAANHYTNIRDVVLLRDMWWVQLLRGQHMSPQGQAESAFLFRGTNP